MFKVVWIIRPKTILSNLEAINRSYEKENAKIREDPKRQHEKEKPLIVIPLFADLYNFLARYRKKELINGKDNFHLGDLHAWCSDHEGLPPPSELDEVFVVRFQIFYADEVYTEEDDYEAASREYVNSSDGVPIESSEVIKIYNKQMSNPKKWRTFDDFCNCAFGYWKITIDKDADENNWKKSTWTCPIYLKQYICKHIIAICIALKKCGTQLPPAAKSQPVGTTRRPGRPRLAVRALLEQPQFRSLIGNNDLSDLDDDDDEVEVEHANYL